MKTRCRILFILTVLIVSVSAAIYISAAAEGGMKMNFTHILNIQIPGVTLKSTEFSDSSKRVYGREREKFIQIGGICRKTENQGRSNEICGGTGMIHTSKQLKDKVRNLSNLERLYKIYTSS